MCREGNTNCDGANKVGDKSHGGGIGVSRNIEKSVIGSKPTFASGRLYFGFQVTTNVEFQKNTFTYKAEQTYTGVGGPPLFTSPSIASNVDLLNNMAGLASDFTPQAGFYPMSIEVGWQESDYGVVINDIEVNNGAPVIANVGNLIFSPIVHDPTIQYPGDTVMHGSSANTADNGGTLNMNVGAVIPKYQNIMTIQIETRGGAYPQAPYIIFSLNNLPPGCSSPIWTR